LAGNDHLTPGGFCEVYGGYFQLGPQVASNSTLRAESSSEDIAQFKVDFMEGEYNAEWGG
jgi:hypothetical protein